MTVGAVKTTTMSMTGATDNSDSASHRPLGWLQAMDGRFAALLTGRLQNIERCVGEGLAWLHTLRHQEQERREGGVDKGAAAATPAASAQRRRRGRTRKSATDVASCLTDNTADVAGVDASSAVSDRAEGTNVASVTPSKAPPMAVSASDTVAKKTEEASSHGAAEAPEPDVPSRSAIATVRIGLVVSPALTLCCLMRCVEEEARTTPEKPFGHRVRGQDPHGQCPQEGAHGHSVNGHQARQAGSSL